MKNEIVKYHSGQIYLLSNGTFALISDVDPITKLKSTEADRRIYIKPGHKHIKNEQFKDSGKHILIIEDSQFNNTISIEVNKNMSCTIQEFRIKEAAFIGEMTLEKQAQYSRVLSEINN